MIEARNAHEQIVLDFFAVMNRHDLEAARACFTEDATWIPQVRDIPGSGEYRGRDAIIDAFLAPMRGVFQPGDPHSEVLSITSGGALVMAETRGTGTLADGRAYDNRYAWAIEVRDGRIAAIREYMDSHYVAVLFGFA
jgi:ketosteroid isomerase-like protein